MKVPNQHTWSQSLTHKNISLKIIATEQQTTGTEACQILGKYDAFCILYFIKCRFMKAQQQSPKPMMN